MCLYERTIKNRKYTKNKKNGGNIPAIPDDRIRWVKTECGECIECRKKKAREWTVRLMEEIKENRNGIYVTLTLSNQSIKKIHNQGIIEKTDYKTKKIKKIKIKSLYGYKMDNAIATYATRKFLERWRKQYKTSVKHWLITELGHEGTENIHMHGFIWVNKQVTYISGRGKKKKTETIRAMEAIKKIWGYGFIWDGYMINGKIENYVTNQTINYNVKYITKIDEKHPGYKAIILCSAGIGKQYITSKRSEVNEYKGDTTDETYRTNTGHKISLPTYWKNKIWTEEEKERLWIQKLDKNETWIMGEKINAEEKTAMLKYWQIRNIEMGYGTGIKDKEQLDYENARRNTLIKKRIKNT